MSPLIKPIKQQRISDQIFEQIRQLIYRGDLKPGSKLMTERELSKTMCVSRTSIRDALSRLKTMGLLIQKQGQGTFVRSYDLKQQNFLTQAMEDQDASLEDLLELRLGLECNAAALAAKRANTSEINAMASSINELKQEFESGRLAADADISFHMSIALATKNPLHILIVNTFNNHLFHGIRENLKYLYKNKNNIKKIILQHKEILHAIENKNPDKAFMSMQKHITFLMDFLKTRPC